MNKPIVWTIAGSDSGGGAGIQADLKTFAALDVHGCSVITAITAQNSHTVSGIAWTSPTMLQAQLSALESDLPAKVIKLGMLGQSNTINVITSFLRKYSGYVVCDPVLNTTSGASLGSQNVIEDLVKKIFPYINLLTPNLLEAETLLGFRIKNPYEIEDAAKQLLKLGPKSILIKGGHSDGKFCQDYWTNGNDHCWLTNYRIDNNNTHGSGCTLSATIAACLALGFSEKDALVIAKMYVSQGIRHAQRIGYSHGPVVHLGWPEQCCDLPWMTDSASMAIQHPQFPNCGNKPLGFYPIVDNYVDIKRLLSLGVKTVQVRIKNKTQIEIEKEVTACVNLAEEYQARLFVNDYWQLALQLKAYGVHLGQEDLLYADLEALSKAGLRLGISTHCYSEIARAHAIRPSYIACGPIYETTSKVMPYAPQGIQQLLRWRRMLDYPLVAIGGINLQRLPDILSTGVDGVAVMSAVSKTKNPEKIALQFMQVIS